jgi:hypothetical protein
VASLPLFATCCRRIAVIWQLDLARVVLLLGSKSINVQRSTALCIGNIGQDDFNRERLGAAGAVEALFLAIADADDYQVPCAMCVCFCWRREACRSYRCSLPWLTGSRLAAPHALPTHTVLWAIDS